MADAASDCDVLTSEHELSQPEQAEYVVEAQALGIIFTF